MTTIARPALRYYGGKWNLAPWIISFFPPHLNYVEPCGGAASVLLQKPRSPLETYNDLDGNVVNFFRVLRDQPDELIRRIRLTPWARAEFDECKMMAGDNLERARSFFAVSKMGLNGSTRMESKQLNWRSCVDSQSPIESDMRNVEHLRLIAERFSLVQIEALPFVEVVPRYDSSSTLIYFDPPYPHETRNDTKIYAFEWCDEDHEIAAQLLRQCAGYVVISGYACPLYADLYEAHGWQRHDKEAQTNSGGKRIESVWLSPRTVEALAKPRQAGLFMESA
jgi:DNA adenine methylase